MKPAYSTPTPPKPPKSRKRQHKPRTPCHDNANMGELKTLRKRCAQQRKELEKLKAIMTVASTSDVENVTIVKQSE